MFTKQIRTNTLKRILLAACLGAATAPSLAAETVVIRDHRDTTRVTTRPDGTEVRDHRSRVSCTGGAATLRRMGYAPVIATDCDGSIYRYSARQGAAIFRAALEPRSGRMDIRFVGIAR